MATTVTSDLVVISTADSAGAGCPPAEWAGVDGPTLCVRDIYKGRLRFLLYFLCLRSL